MRKGTGDMELTRRGFLLAGASLMMAGCSKKVEYGTDSSGETSAPKEDKADTDNRTIELVESGWSYAEGWLILGFTIRNASEYSECAHPRVSITGKDADGKVLFSESLGVKFMRPGDEFTVGAEMRQDVEPATVEFATAVGKNKWKESDATDVTEPYTFGNMSMLEDHQGYAHFTGEMTVNKVWDDVDSVIASVIIRDKDQNILGGTNTFVNDVSGYSEGDVIPVEAVLFGVKMPSNASSFYMYAAPSS